MLSGSRMPASSANFSAGMSLPRAMPAISGMIASTSEMPWSRKNCWISLGINHLQVLHPFPAGGAKGGEQRHRERVVHHPPFRVPLHGQRKAARRGHAEGLDEAIARARLDAEAAAELAHALAMERIHLQAVRTASQPLQQPTGRERD